MPQAKKTRQSIASRNLHIHSMSSARECPRGPNLTIHQNVRRWRLKSYGTASRSLVGETRSFALRAPVEQLAGNRRQPNFTGLWRCYQMLARRNDLECA